MIGIVVWWLVCRAFHVPTISVEMLDAIDAAIREEASKR